MTALTKARDITAVVVARLRADRRLRIASVAAVALVVAAALALWPSGSGSALDDGKPTALRTRPDPVPAALGPTPADCGLSMETRADLVPGGRPMEKSACWLYAVDDGKSNCRLCPTDGRYRERSLQIDRDEWTADNVPVSSVFQPLASMGPDPLQRISGLGDEAFVHYGVSGLDGTAIVSFRFRGSDFRVKFEASDSPGEGDAKPLPEKPAVAGALRAATDVAKSVGAPARPAPMPPLPVGPAASTVRPPNACELVSGKMLDKVARGAVRARGDGGPLIDAYGTATDSCVWEAERRMSDGDEPSSGTESRSLRVTLTAAPDREPGFGVRAATHGYLGLHYGLRDGTGRGRHQRMKAFTALSGLGEQAFGGYHIPAPRTGEGLVVFRVRNMLVEVAYNGWTGPVSGGNPMPQDRAVRGAYTAALAVAGSLHA